MRWKHALHSTPIYYYQPGTGKVYPRELLQACKQLSSKTVVESEFFIIIITKIDKKTREGSRKGRWMLFRCLLSLYK